MRLSRCQLRNKPEQPCLYSPVDSGLAISVSLVLCITGAVWGEWVASFSPIDRDVLQPGETGPVVIYILTIADVVFPREQVWVGREFTLCFGTHVRGRGVITAIQELDERGYELLGIAPL